MQMKPSTLSCTNKLIIQFYKNGLKSSTESVLFHQFFMFNNTRINYKTAIVFCDKGFFNTISKYYVVIKL